MSFQRLPNSGIMSHDGLDDMRVAAVMAHHDTPVPLEVILYLRALEEIYLDALHERKKQSAREIGWVLPGEAA